MDRCQLQQRRIALGLGLYVLNRYRIKRDVGNRIAGLINHVSPAVFTNLDGRYNII